MYLCSEGPHPLLQINQLQSKQEHTEIKTAFVSHSYAVQLLSLKSTVVTSDVHITTNSVAQEHEGSSLHPQQLATGPYPELVESNPPPSQSP
jgi:hypothetical protein